MTDSNKSPKPRMTPEMALAALQAKQRALAIKAAKIQKDIDDRRNASSLAQKARLGKLAAEAGILELPDDVLKAAFAQLAAQQANMAGADAPGTIKEII